MNDAHDPSGLTLLADIRHEADGIELRSPAVGLWTRRAVGGSLVGPGSSLGFIRTLNRRYELLLPDGVAGRIDDLPAQKVVALEYGALLARLVAIGTGEGLALSGAKADTGRSADRDLPPGFSAVVAPTDGVFYRRPTPDSPPFVEPGEPLHSGQPVGLVEVMKTFNQILYGGPGFADEVVVEEVRCGDGEEVQAGQILIVVRQSDATAGAAGSGSGSGRPGGGKDDGPSGCSSR